MGARPPLDDVLPLRGRDGGHNPFVEHDLLPLPLFGFKLSPHFLSPCRRTENHVNLFLSSLSRQILQTLHLCLRPRHTTFFSLLVFRGF